MMIVIIIIISYNQLLQLLECIINDNFKYLYNLAYKNDNNNDSSKSNIIYKCIIIIIIMLWCNFNSFNACSLALCCPPYRLGTGIAVEN